MNGVRSRVSSFCLLAIAVLSCLLLFTAALVPAQANAEEIADNSPKQIVVDSAETYTFTYKASANSYFTVGLKSSRCTMDYGSEYPFESDCSFLSLVVSQGGTTFYDHYVLDLNQELVSIPLLFKAGTPVTIRVAGERGYREEADLTIHQQKYSYIEKEGNNSKSKATALKLRKSYVGVVNDASDKDCFAFKSGKTAKYKVQVRVEYSPDRPTLVYDNYKATVDSGAGWKTVYSGSIKKGATKRFSLGSFWTGVLYNVRVVRA